MEMESVGSGETTGVRRGVDCGRGFVRDATGADLAQIVAVHRSAFPGFFLTVLGDRFLGELYRGFLHDPSSICLVAEDAGQPIGFVVGTTEPQGFFKRLLLRHWYRFLLAGLMGLARHPLRVGRRFLDALSYRGEAPEGILGGTLLSSVGVSPSAGGRGLGAALVESFCRQAAVRGEQWVYLVTDSAGNEPVNRFYARCGFTLESSFQRPNGRAMNRYLRTLADTKASNADGRRRVPGPDGAARNESALPALLAKGPC